MKLECLIKSVPLAPRPSVLLSQSLTTPGPGPWWSYLSGASNSVLSASPVKQSKIRGEILILKVE